MANKISVSGSYCRNSFTVTDTTVKEFLCRELKMPSFDEQAARSRVESIVIGHDGSFGLIFRQ